MNNKNDSCTPDSPVLQPTTTHSSWSTETHHEHPVPIHHDNDSDSSQNVTPSTTYAHQQDPETSSSDKQSKTKNNSEKEKKGTSPSEPQDSGIVPRKERRGLLAQMCLIPERVNPYEHSPLTKAVLLIIVAVASIIAPMGGAIFLPAIDVVVEEFHSTKDIINISYGIYVFALAIFPLWWSSFSEQFGRRSIYVISFTGYAGLLVGSALAQNIGTLMVCRFLAGGFASSVQAVGAGTISDIYVATQRGRAIGYFYLGPLLGPLLGPIIGGLVNARWGWRGTQWFLVILAGAIILAVILILPETLLKREYHDTSEDTDSSCSSIASKQEEEEEGEQEQEKLAQQNGSELARKQSNRPKENASLARIRSHASVMSRHSILDNDFDNTDVGDTFVPVFPAPTHQEDDDDADNTMWSTPTGKGNKNGMPDLESQVRGMESVTKVRTTASEKERRLINASAQINFKALTFREKFVWLFFRPLKSFKFFQYPPVALTIFYGAICFMSLYFLNVSLESLYGQAPYNFGSILVGLTYIPNSMGYFISSVLTGKYSDYIIRREKAKLGYFNPESRFAVHYYVAMVVYPLSLIMFGWTAEYKLHWTVPLVANLFFGLSSIVVMSTSATYLVDALPGKGSSGVALNNLVRFSFAGFATFVAEPMCRGLGNGWMYTLLAFVSFAASVFIVAIKRWGPKWRSEADFEKLYR